MRKAATALGAMLATALMAGAVPTPLRAAPGGDKSASPPAGPPMLQTTTRRLNPVVEARRLVADAKSDVGRYRQIINRKRQKHWPTATAAISGGPGALVELRSIRSDMRNCETVVTELLAAAVAADPGATEAKGELDKAEAKLTALREEHVDWALDDDAEYVSAASQLKDAEARLEAAEAQLAKAAQDSKDAKEQARLAYLAEQEAIRKARMAAPS
jgi:hypothetical protein